MFTEQLMPYFDAAAVKASAQNRWGDLLPQLGVDASCLRNVHGPCPGCGGKDRFRFDDNEGHGTFICSQGGGDLLAGDGFDLLVHAKNVSWKQALDAVANLLAVQPSASTGAPRPPPPAPPLKPTFRNEKLAKFADRWRAFVDTAWLADRSAIDPCGLSRTEFLRTLYRPSERVLCFTEPRSQGQAIWPDETPPSRGEQGVWFLAQPVDGRTHPNPRNNGKLSRRSEESVASWRFLVLESDKAPARDWLAALVQLPLAVAAIYTSGGKSVHVLVKVDAPSLHEWRAFSSAIQPVLVTLGADQQVVASAVRLTRLPGCWRGDRLQKLLYLNPDPAATPICALPRLRDVLAPVADEADSLLTRTLGDIAFRYRVKSLGELIAAAETHEATLPDRARVMRRLAWFETTPRACELLSRLRDSVAG